MGWRLKTENVTDPLPDSLGWGPSSIWFFRRVSTPLHHLPSVQTPWASLHAKIAEFPQNCPNRAWITVHDACLGLMTIGFLLHSQHFNRYHKGCDIEHWSKQIPLLAGKLTSPVPSLCNLPDVKLLKLNDELKAPDGQCNVSRRNGTLTYLFLQGILYRHNLLTLKCLFTSSFFFWSRKKMFLWSFYQYSGW